MSRPLRLEYAGSLYHAKSRGDRQENIYENDIDRKELLLVFCEVCGRYNLVFYA